MLIYADHKTEYNTLEYIFRIRRVLDTAEERSFSDHSINTELLIIFGEFESALTDLLSASEDDHNILICTLREASLLCGLIFNYSYNSSYSYNSNYSGSYEAAGKLNRILSRLANMDLPENITISLPEGYAYYGLYPEMYLVSAEEFTEKRNPENVIVIGIRSIGTSLSAAVAACMKLKGCLDELVTIRPRGEYYNREVKISDKLKSILNKKNSYYLIIDEGPGLSGSSFCSVAEYLSNLGIEDEKIILFPSYEADPDNFVSGLAKERYRKHEKYTAAFETVMLESGRLTGQKHYGNIHDISAGKWRELFYKDESRSPAVYQNFEQRKYIFRDESTFFIKFAGLGHYGRKLFERALKLAEAGFSPKAQKISNGFIWFELIDGRPLEKEDIKREVLDKFAHYLAFIKKEFPAKPSMTIEEIKEMIRINVNKGLGEEWTGKTDGIYLSIPEAFEEHSVEIDGRMLPYEWIKTKNGLIKTDSIHHHSDHLLPGNIDIAWDVAGVITECGLSTDMENYFLSRYKELSHDKTISERLKFYISAYLLFRLGYTKFASERLGATSDGIKFGQLSEYYAFLFKMKII
ncbi:MAG: hypothetical protein ACM34K_11940 [Bacillota bacterium]